MRNDLRMRVLRALPDGQALAGAASGLAWGVLSLYFQAPVVETARYLLAALAQRAGPGAAHGLE